MLGGWVNPHREQQTIPQGQTSLPPKSFSTPTANGQSALRTGSARGGVGRRGKPHTEHGLGVHSHSGIDEKRPTEKFVLYLAYCFKYRFLVTLDPFFVVAWESSQVKDCF